MLEDVLQESQAQIHLALVGKPHGTVDAPRMAPPIGLDSLLSNGYSPIMRINKFLRPLYDWRICCCPCYRN